MTNDSTPKPQDADTPKPSPIGPSRFWLGFARITPWLIFVSMIALMGIVYARWDVFQGAQQFQVTNNAYIHFDTLMMETKVGGYIRQVGFTDFQHLDEGSLLISLVDDDYRMNVLEAEAKRDRVAANLENLKLEEELQRAYIEQARATLLSAEARLERAERESVRIDTLFKQHVVSDSEADTAIEAVKTTRASKAECVAMLAVQERKLSVLTGDRSVRQAELKAAEAALENAKIDLGYTKLIAPERSTAGACNFRAGELVKAGTQIAKLMIDDSPHIVANYKETQMTNVRAGQPVSIKVDTFPNHVFKGHVESISPATGATYSLLPTDNSAGNFTKVVQRIPVRIVFDKDQPLLDQLRAGMSVTTSIDTQSHAKPVTENEIAAR